VLPAALVFEVLLLTAAAAWWPIYESSSFVVLALVTATVGVAIGAAGAIWSWPSYAVLGAALAAWLLLGVPLAVPSKALGGVLPTPGGIVDLIVATAAGWRQLLTIALPVGDYQALLVPAFVLLLFASVLGVSVATRTAHPVTAMVFPGVVLVAGIAFGGRTAFAPVVLGALFAVVSIVWLLITRGRLSARTVGAAGGVVAIGLVVAVVATTALPAADRVVARNAIEQPFDLREQSSPLAGFRAYSKSPLADSAVLTVSGAAAGDRVVVARMNDYDGVVFSVGGADGGALFSRVPGRLDGAGAGDGEGAGDDEGGAGSGGSGGIDSVGDEGRLSTVAFRVGEFSGIWVPTIGDPVAVSFDGPGADALQNALFSSASLATVADTAGLAPGDRYSLTTRLDVARPADPDALADLTPGAPVEAASDAVPDAVAARAADWAPSSSSPGERLAGIVSGLRAGYVSSGGEGEVFSRSGHGADRLQELLTSTPMLGDDEQYAAAGALLAEAAGFPARVALGFVVPEGTSAASGDDGVELLGRDAHAWVEVLTAEAGWVPLDVTPEPRPIPDSAVDDSSTAVQPPDVVPPAGDDLDDDVDSAPLQQNDEKPTVGDDSLANLLRILLIVGISVAAFALVLAPFVVILGLKRRRRMRRRRDGSPRSRAAGGWAELVDTAADVAAAPPPNATRREAAAALGGGATLLAERVDGALYSPAEPTEQELESIWAASDAERRRLLGERGRVARLLARVSTTSLHARRGRRRTASTSHGASTGMPSTDPTTSYHGNDEKRRNNQ
jgi:hypothetical protein